MSSNANAALGSVSLADGRHLVRAEYGDVAGAPLLYMHGTPSCHLEAEAFGVGQAARRLGIRVVVADRPGMSESSFQRGRRVLDWPADVSALADQLGVERFAVLGYSGGVPYAAATDYALGERVRALGLVATVAHLEPGLEEGLHPNGLMLKRLCRERPALARLVMTVGMRPPARFPPLLVRMMNVSLPDPDRAALGRAEMRDGFPAAIREAFRHGARGAQLDEGLMSAPWGFDPAGIAVPARLWQGTADNFGARPAMAESLQAAIPDSKLRLSPDGHLSILTEHLDEILTALK
jgi:pimeloyl-ACP methyl ester carboxylesterase